MIKVKDKLKIIGYVEVFASKKAPRLVKGQQLFMPNGQPYPVPKYEHLNLDFRGKGFISKTESKNIIVDVPKERIISSFNTGFMRVIGRMSVGDRGTLPSDPTTPKVPLVDRTELYHEVYRDDIDAFTENADPTIHEVQYVTTFDALDVPITSMSNQANPVINEVGLIMVDLIGGNPLPRGPVAAPNANDADEELFGMRAFKSVPFDKANELSITIRYTIAIE